ncbi:MAG: CopG-like 1 or ribbon-helix-helix domain, 5 [Cyanobacteriota bacterium]|jgi:macrodomain Ter protein organizer (MatP/YcbG family)
MARDENGFRAPRRISVTVSHAVWLKLRRVSDWQGRSTSNLAAYLLEKATEELQEPPGGP